MSTSSSSDSQHSSNRAKEAARELLRVRKLRFLETQGSNYPSFQHVLKDRFTRFGGTHVVLSHSMKAVFTSEYVNELAFDSALFVEMTNLLKEIFTSTSTLKRKHPQSKAASSKGPPSRFAVVSVKEHTANQLVLSFKRQGKECYIGLTRQCDQLAKMKNYHAVATFKPTGKHEGGGYEVSCILAVAEVKVQEQSGPPSFILDTRQDKIEAPKLLRCHRFLAQVLMYTLDQVWHGICSCGVARDEIPWAVVLGRGQGVGNKGQLRSVRGKVVPPRTCCDYFQYSVESFTTFKTNSETSQALKFDDEEVIVDCVAAAYFEAICFGLDVALESFFDASQDCRPLSGQKLIIRHERVDEDVAILYPDFIQILATDGICSTSHHSSGNVAQGDLFEGVLPGAVLLKMHAAASGGITNLWFGLPAAKDYSVIVKASSCAIHPQMVASGRAFSALRAAMIEGSASLKQHLSKVLVAVYATRLGLISIMHDLRTCGFNVLNISKKPVSGARPPPCFPLRSLWAAFRQLAFEMLLPLAELEYVHCDIRAGYDSTSNILFRATSVENSGAINLEMVLIDLDSLITFDALTPFLDEDGRYVGVTMAEDALDYLWWQCVLLAYVWSTQLDQEDLAANKNILYDVPRRLMKRAQAKCNNRNCIKGPKQPLCKSAPSQVHATNSFEEWLLEDEVMVVLLSSKSKRQIADNFGEMLDRVSLFFDQVST